MSQPYLGNAEFCQVLVRVHVVGIIKHQNLDLRPSCFHAHRFQLGLVKLYGLSSVCSFLYQLMGSVECLDNYCIVRFNGLNLFEYSLVKL